MELSGIPGSPFNPCKPTGPIGPLRPGLPCWTLSSVIGGDGVNISISYAISFSNKLDVMQSVSQTIMQSVSQTS